VFVRKGTGRIAGVVWLIALLLCLVVAPSYRTEVAHAAPAPGTVVALQGTPHLWIVGEDGLLHWAGDTRALAGRTVNWASRFSLALEQLRAQPRGDPWLSAGLLKDGDPIYLVKWETDWPQPKLLHIQSIQDVELFGITAANYGRFVLDRATWEQRYGFRVNGLVREELPAVVIAPELAGLPSAQVAGHTVYWLPAWQWQAQDSRLVLGLAVLNTFSPEWRKTIGPRLTARRTRIGWGNLPANVGGVYYVWLNRIVVNQALQGDSLGVLAAVLAHETSHAVAPPPTHAADCFEAEIAAYTWEARVWQVLPSQFRSSSQYGRWHDELVHAVAGGTIREIVLTNPDYRAQCLHWRLPDL
jgi:hypothetical protein